MEQTPEQIHIRDYLVSVRPGIADRPSQTPELTLDAGLSRSIGDADIVSGVVSKTLTLKVPSATIWAQSCLAWAIFQSPERRAHAHGMGEPKLTGKSGDTATVRLLFGHFYIRLASCFANSLWSAARS